MPGSRGTFTSVSGHGGFVVVFNSSRNATNGVVTPTTYTFNSSTGVITPPPYSINNATGAVTVAPPGYTFSGITKWDLTKSAVLTEITNSGSRGWQQRKAVVRGGQFSIDFVWDANTVPDGDVTLDAGDEPLIAFKRGANAGYYEFPGIVETMKLTDDNQKDVLRGTVSGFVNGPIYNRAFGPLNGA